MKTISTVRLKTMNDIGNFIAVGLLLFAPLFEMCCSDLIIDKVE